MGTAADHIHQARGNLAFVRRLLGLPDADLDDITVQWAVTAAFYSVVHYVEADLAAAGVHSKNHGARYAAMMRRGYPADVLDAYRCLRDFSEHTCYGLARFSPTFARETVLKKYLGRVECHFEPAST